MAHNQNKYIFLGENSREYYTITENVTKKNKKKLEKNGEFISSTEEYYQTDGVFCSFNCCKAFIEDNKHKRVYDNSSLLLLKMYNEITFNYLK